MKLRSETDLANPFSMRILRTLPVLLLFCMHAAPADALNPKKLPQEERDKITAHFLQKVVRAKIGMPMTTAGISVRWTKKKQQWVVDTNDHDLSYWGAGVRAGEKKAITAVKFKYDAVELWLNDGGVISTADVLFSPLGGRDPEVEAKRFSANGSRIKIVVDQLPPDAPIFDLVREQAAKFVDLVDEPLDQRILTGEPVFTTGTLAITSVPTNAELVVDGSFVGQCPAKLTLPSGRHKLRVFSPGFLDWEREIDVLANSEVSLHVALTTNEKVEEGLRKEP